MRKRELMAELARVQASSRYWQRAYWRLALYGKQRDLPAARLTEGERATKPDPERLSREDLDDTA